MESTVIKRRAWVSAHVIVSVAWLGVGACLIAVLASAGTATDPGGLQAIYNVAHAVHERVFVPLAVMTAATGIALCLITKRRFFRYYWVIAKEAIIIMLVGVGVAVVPRGIQTVTRIVSSRGLNSLQDPMYRTTRETLIAYFAFQVALLSASVIISVFKPFGQRTPRLPR